MERKQLQHRRVDEEDTEAPEEVASGDHAAEVAKLKKDTDEILDEIDDILEHNAEEFVRSYVQKGGQ